MAGVYTATDNAFGVWRAPANVSLNAVVSPILEISDAQQADMNGAVDGMAVNADSHVHRARTAWVHGRWTATARTGVTSTSGAH